MDNIVNSVGADGTLLDGAVNIKGTGSATVTAEPATNSIVVNVPTQTPIQVVSELPASPDNSTIYFVVEE